MHDFHPAVSDWFRKNFSEPTAVQNESWPAIASGQHTLLAAPTGSGKTIISEFAMLRVFKNTPKKKVIYIAPLKALAKERIIDWKMRLGGALMKKSVLEQRQALK